MPDKHVITLHTVPARGSSSEVALALKQL